MVATTKDNVWSFFILGRWFGGTEGAGHCLSCSDWRRRFEFWHDRNSTLNVECCADVTSEHEFLITADMAGRNIYQLRLGRGRIVRLLTLNLERRPAAVAFDVPRRVIYWTDIATARIVSRPLITPVYNTRPTTVYTACNLYQFNIITITILIKKCSERHKTCALTVVRRRKCWTWQKP